MGHDSFLVRCVLSDVLGVMVPLQRHALHTPHNMVQHTGRLKSSVTLQWERQILQ